MLIPIEMMTYENLDALAPVFSIHRMDTNLPDSPSKGCESVIPAENSAADLTGDAAVMWDIFMEKLVRNGYLPKYGGPYLMKAFTSNENSCAHWLPWACREVEMSQVTVRHPLREGIDIDTWPIYTKVLDHEQSLDWHVVFRTRWRVQNMSLAHRLRKRCMLLRTLGDVEVLPSFPEEWKHRA